jgi:hypothetical protein
MKIEKLQKDLKICTMMDTVATNNLISFQVYLGRAVACVKKI